MPEFICSLVVVGLFTDEVFVFFFNARDTLNGPLLARRSGALSRILLLLLQLDPRHSRIGLHFVNPMLQCSSLPHRSSSCLNDPIDRLLLSVNRFESFSGNDSILRIDATSTRSSIGMQPIPSLSPC